MIQLRNQHVFCFLFKDVCVESVKWILYGAELSNSLCYQENTIKTLNDLCVKMTKYNRRKTLIKSSKKIKIVKVFGCRILT